MILILDPIPETIHVAMLDSGIDLILFRPVSPRLLRAQIKALMRRVSGMPLTILPTLSVGPVNLDPSTRAVEVAGCDPRRLTHLEFRLLYTLMMHEGQIMSVDQLVERVWGYSGDKDHDLTRNLVRRLRSKLEPDPKNPQYLITAPGLGYVFMPKSNIL
jgi:two-component system response regulator RpaA